VSDPRTEATQRRLAYHAAVLFLLGGLTGGYLSAAETGKLAVDPGHARAAHLNAILATFWLLGLGWSLGFARLSPAKQSLLAGLAILSSYANWLVTAVKAAFFVRGVDLESGTPHAAANNIIFAVLTATVVLPTIGACALWIWALRPGAPALPAPAGRPGA
jgi:hydroxylaminobenzene mutase